MKHAWLLLFPQIAIVLLISMTMRTPSLNQETQTYAQAPQAQQTIIPTVTVSVTAVPTTATPTEMAIPTKVQIIHYPVVASDASIYTLLNAYRQSNGIPQLQENSMLIASSLAKAQDMVSSDYFNHTSPSGVSWTHFVLVAGYHYTATAENLAIGFSTAQSVMQAWEASPVHNANMLNATYQDVGVTQLCGVSLDGYVNTCIYVMHLGKL